MPWILLLAAGLMEVGWAAALPATRGFTRPLPSTAFLGALVASMVLLERAARSLPLGTAYAGWVGIGVVGTAVVGVVFHHDPAGPLRLAFLALLVISLVGLELTG